MNPLLRQLLDSSEQDARQTQRSLARLTRAVRDAAITPVPTFNPPRPLYGTGPSPVFVANMPFRIGR